MQVLKSRIFNNELVELDGRKYVNCKFVNCTFLYSGDRHILERCRFRGRKNYHFIEAAGRTVNLLAGLRLLKSGVKIRTDTRIL